MIITTFVKTSLIYDNLANNVRHMFAVSRKQALAAKHDSQLDNRQTLLLKPLNVYNMQLSAVMVSVQFYCGGWMKNISSLSLHW